MEFIGSWMGIPERKEREKELRKLQILVAAKKVFFNKGFGRATMEDIAKEAELSAGTLYLYFKTKNELNASLTLRILEYLVIRLEQLHNDYDMDAVGKINNIKSALLDVYEFDPLILRHLLMLQTNDIIKKLSQEMVDRISDLERQALNSIADIFRQAIRKGVCLDLHPRAIADIVWSLFSGVVMREFSKRAFDGQQNNVGQALEFAFDIFVKGIRGNLDRAAASEMGEYNPAEA